MNNAIIIYNHKVYNRCDKTQTHNSKCLTSINQWIEKQRKNKRNGVSACNVREINRLMLRTLVYI